MNRLSLLTGSALAACVVLAGAPASAQAVRTFDIPAGSLREALNGFAAQADQQIFFTADLVEGRRSEGLRGRYAPREALDLLLRGSGLGWTETRPGVLVLRRTALAEETAVQVEDIVVTGTLLNVSGDLAAPVVTLDRAELDRRGFGTVAEALTDLPQNYAGSATPVVQLTGSDRGGSNAVYATGVNLRGLGPSSTLLLVNGRRLAGTGFRAEFGDASALPSAAVERVDVLLDGASALYGSDAVAGVVNVILRRRFDGQESRLRVSAAQGGAEDVSLSHMAGRSWGSGAALGAYEYQTTRALSSLDRPYTANGDLRPFGGTDHRGLYASPGNILVYDAAAGAYRSQFAIRPGPSGVATGPGDFAAGEANLQISTLGADLLPASDRHAAYLSLRQDAGARLELSGDLRFSLRDFDFRGQPNVGLTTVSRANPYFVSPTGAASHIVGYAFGDEVGPIRRTGSSRSLGGTAGFRFALSPDWTLDAYAAWAEERGALRNTNRVNSRFVAEALGNIPDDPATAYSAARDGYLNLFGAGSTNSRAVLDFIRSGFTEARDRSRAASVNALVQGPVMELPAGPLQVAIGGQARRETFDTRTRNFFSTAAPVETVLPTRERRIEALFAEARLPLVSPEMGLAGVRSLEVSAAARVERYDDFGRTINPKVGLVWSPAAELTARATWGSAFRAASLPQIYDAPGASGAFINRPDGSSALTLFLVGGNESLKPETAETFTAGFDWRPAGGVFSLTYFDTQFEDRIAQPVAENLLGVLGDPALSPFVTLINPAGNAADLQLIQSYAGLPGFPSFYPIDTYAAVVDARWVNTGAVAVRGLDLSARRALSLDAGQLLLETSGSWMLDYETRPTPVAPVRQVAGLIGYPVRLRARTGARWVGEAVDLGVHWNHVSDYRDRNGRRIDAWNTADLQLGWSPRAGSGTRLTLTVQNLFDADPPFHDAATGFGFDPGQASLLGRVAALQLIRRW